MKIMCNKCGKEIRVEREIPKEDFLQVEKKWGYFSKKDRITQKFILCEECYDEIIKTFLIPVDERETTEIFP